LKVGKERAGGKKDVNKKEKTTWCVGVCLKKQTNIETLIRKERRGGLAMCVCPKGHSTEISKVPTSFMLGVFL
jgi:hypothetical protein